MNILFIGDIYGSSGRDVVKRFIPILKEQYKIDFVIANGENASHGRGLIAKHYFELVEAGIDCITVGNHFFSKNNSMNYYTQTTKLVRPYNLASGTAGVGSRIFEVNGIKIQVSSIIGRVWMKDFGQLDIYKSMDKLLESETAPIHIVDFHGEPGSEKLSFAHNYAKKVSAVIGTHTHVQTADEDIFENHCGYISDAGMSGPYKSVIGADIKQVIARNKSPIPLDFDVSYDQGQFNGVILNINDDGTCTHIERINIRPGRDYERN